MNKTLRAECERMAPVLANQLREIAEPEDILLLLAKHSAALNMPNMDTPGRWESLGTVYVEQLGDLPVSSLEQAFTSWHHGELYPEQIQRHAFFPKPAELRKLAERHLVALRMAAYRAKKFMAETPPPSEDRSSDEWQRKNREEMRAAGYLNADGNLDWDFLKPKSVPRDSPRPTQTPQQAAARLRGAADEAVI